jgi:hypothetical protein
LKSNQPCLSQVFLRIFPKKNKLKEEKVKKSKHISISGGRKSLKEGEPIFFEPILKN